ncbi:ShlB/FhaC/HecB family hemolysin secretion/activation protein [Yersinia enterocolitica]|uniref:ShlB/FhaC/HecB family hemolysin secretion/activation protein n=1 Tax=Yersinia enterocolitica TaxID=630 RepID=UPI001C8D1451|nr:ShlB/FhaC/HecB family hemolysin secretion/activation protein [Yersinia enterocolitica]MBX9496221.1 ShlB/FhaC/HecB family hemolysin secretion/activation protein [Yersinia enterocolitica]
MRVKRINHGVTIFYKKTGGISILLFFLIFISTSPLIVYAKINQLTAPTGVGSSDDSSCLVIKRVELMNIDAFPNAGRLIPWAKQAQGNCLDDKGLSSLRDTFQWQLVADGYITSHVTFTEDSYVDGTLFLTLIPGRLASIEHHEDSQGYAQLNTVFPGQQGDLVNLRNLEQGLDNLQRLPSVNATMDVVLNPEDLSSQIMVTRQQSRFWRMNAFLDDAGHYGVGRYRAGATLFLDNPLSLSDLAYFSASRELDNHHDKGNHNFALHYSIPFGYWLLSLTGNQGTYYQSLLVGNSTFKYQTRWRSLDMQIQRLLMRGHNYKTVGYLGTLIRKSNRFFADIELEIQRVDAVDWQLGLQHLYYTHWATIGGGVNYQQGVSWFGARPSPGNDEFPVTKLINITASLDIPFMLGQQRFHYQPVFNQQYTHSNLPIQDHFSIGGRHSVRGFSSRNALMGPQGWFLKNDIVWINQRLANKLYVGLDYGEVRKKGGQSVSGKRLIGGVLGIRGHYHKFGYDFNIGLPLYKPSGLDADSMVLGFMMNWQY